MSIQRIGVVGAGQMGTGIAHVLALAGYDVVLDDLNKDALSKALERIEKNMQRQAAKGVISEDAI
jgi:3-hydroxybutyryl-CoA dehydrogenase